LGALPLFFEERPGGRGPVDPVDLPVPHDDPLDDDPPELFTALGRRGLHRVEKSQDPRPIGDPQAAE
jgi:hypothetical protein